MTTPTGLSGPPAVFDRAAETYDNVGVPWFRPIAEGLVAELAPSPGERALDVGCGRGAVLEPMARLVGPTGSALGIDLAPGMVRLTAADVADLPWVSVREGDASDPDLPPGSFDMVASSLVLFFLVDPATALRRWRALLVPGGRLGVATFTKQDARWHAVDAVFQPYLPQALKDARTSGTQGPFATDAGMEALFRDAGLADVRTAHRTVWARFRDAEHLIAFSWSHGQRSMWEAVPESDRDDVAQQIAAVVRDFQPEAGGFAFSQEVRYTLGRRQPEDPTNR